MMATRKVEMGAPGPEVSERAGVRFGAPLPLGTHERRGGVNLAIFSREASRVRLELFDHPEDAVPARAIALDPARNRIGDVWHVWVKGIASGQLHACRVDEPYTPSERHRFTSFALLLAGQRRGEAECALVSQPFECDGDRPPRRSWSKTIDYETHVRGLAIHPNPGVEHPGTSRGLIEKLPCLRTLEITAVELMPVQQFNETSVTRQWGSLS